MLNHLAVKDTGKIKKLYSLFILSSLFCISVLNHGFANTQIDCFKQASLAFGASQEQAAEVCEAADSNTPAICFLNAINVKNISPKVASELCKYALNMGPADCFRSATVINGLNEKSALNLCKTHRPCFQYERSDQSKYN